MSDPMSLWKATMSLFRSSTSPYMWLWKVPLSVIITPGKSRSSWSFPSSALSFRVGSFLMI